MILTDQEMRQLRNTLEANAGFDEELLKRCAPLMHMNKFDEAVRNAFVLLEERLRTAVDKEDALTMIEQELGTEKAGQVRVFLGRCQKLGLKSKSAKNWLPFRAYALQTRSHWSESKPHRLAVFYLVADKKNPALWFPVNQYYTTVVGLETEPIARQLRQLGFVPTGRNRDYRLNLRDKHDAEFFENLYNLVVRIEQQFEATL